MDVVQGRVVVPLLRSEDGVVVAQVETGQDRHCRAADVRLSAVQNVTLKQGKGTYLSAADVDDAEDTAENLDAGDAHLGEVAIEMQVMASEVH